MQAKPEHEVAYQDICQLMRKHAEHLTPLELLAVASNCVGKLVAMQDQRLTSIEAAMRVVSSNIELGNAQAVAELMKSQGAA